MKYLVVVLFLWTVCAFHKCESVTPPTEAWLPTFSSNETLRSVADDLSLNIGMAYSVRGSSDQYGVAFNQVASTQFNLYVAENGCKLPFTQTKRDSWDFSGCDRALAYARSLKAQFRGHNLIWRSFQPSWLQEVAKNSTSQEMEGILTKHIKTVLNYYKGQKDITVWDVVNEALNDDQSGAPAGGYLLHQDPIWWKYLPDYVELAFRTARATDPNIKLFYNDYSIEYTGKYNALVNMIKDLKKKNITIDGVGFQMHTQVNNYPSTDRLKALFSNLTSMGLEVQITEMDVECPDPCNQTKFADAYVSALRACVETPRCTGFLVWGATDYFSWLTSSKHPLPWDDLGVPKQAAKEMLLYLQTVRNRTITPTPASDASKFSLLTLFTTLIAVVILVALV